MRRKQCEMHDINEVKAILKRATIGRMASIGEDGFPYITPVNYVFWQEAIYFHCAPTGEKIENILRNNKVCFEVDIPLAYLGIDFEPQRPSCQVHQFYHSVIIRGKAHLVDDTTTKVAALNALMKSHEKDTVFKPITEETKAVKMCSVVRIEVDNISGKSDLAQKKSDVDKSKIATYLNNRNLPGDKEAASLIGANNG